LGPSHLRLKAFQGLERTEQLREHRAAIAQKRLHRARPVAVANQLLAKRFLQAALSARSGPAQLVPQRSSLEAVGTAGSPGRHHDSRDQIRLERANRGELGVHRRLERPEGSRILVDKKHQLARKETVLQGVASRAQAAGRGLGTARPGAVATARKRASSSGCHGMASCCGCPWLCRVTET
jgi:hypothetical protein